jgi:hypothetical protein
VLGVWIGVDQAAQTNDIDIASFERLSLALEDQVDPNLAQVFNALDFKPLPVIGDRKVWRWRQTRQQTLIEFLTPSFQHDEGLRDLPVVGHPDTLDLDGLRARIAAGARLLDASRGVAYRSGHLAGADWVTRARLDATAYGDPARLVLTGRCPRLLAGIVAEWRAQTGTAPEAVIPRAGRPPGLRLT